MTYPLGTYCTCKYLHGLWEKSASLPQSFLWNALAWRRLCSRGTARNRVCHHLQHWWPGVHVCVRVTNETFVCSTWHLCLCWKRCSVTHVLPFTSTGRLHFVCFSQLLIPILSKRTFLVHMWWAINFWVSLVPSLHSKAQLAVSVPNAVLFCSLTLVDWATFLTYEHSQWLYHKY